MIKLILTALACLATSAHGLDVKTKYGIVTGTNNGTAITFKGIPYATAARFAPPQEPKTWRAPRIADKFGNVCPQPSLLDKTKMNGDEDCLFLNVFRPKTVTTPLPVMVFIHGGANTLGSAADSLLGTDLYDGSVLSTHNVIVVTLNYRLGALGFLALNGVGNGNYALLDQIAALKFVKENIANFGGDPSNVTLFGESAGAINTLGLITSPLARGLFNKAIVESGFMTEQPLAKALQDGEAYAKAAGCADVACLKALPAKDLILAAHKLNNATVSSASLTIDGTILPKGVLQAMKDRDAMKIPLIIGTTADEMRTLLPGLVDLKSGFGESDMHKMLVEYFGADKTTKIEAVYPASGYATTALRLEDIMGDALTQCPTRQITRAMSKTAPVYRYVFSHVSYNSMLSGYGAGHGMELPYVFSTMSTLVYYGDEFKLASDIGTWWATFATLGSPFVATQTPWTSNEGDAYMNLDVKSEMGANFHGARCDFWESL